MKYVILYLAISILLIPPIIIGCITWLWNPTKKGFLIGSQWLDERYNYGTWINNLIEATKD